MNALSLRNRLRISILGLVVTIVLALSALNLQSSIQETLSGADDRARLVAEYVRRYLAGRAMDATQIRRDELLGQLLQESLVHSKFVSEVLVVNQAGLILASSDTAHIGQTAPRLRPFSDVQSRQTWADMVRLFQSKEDYSMDAEASSTVSARVVISSALLRATVVPELRQLAVVALVSLLLSGLIAIVISDLVGGSLERIERNIELISTGESREPDEQFQSAELASLQTKLSLLGKQYRGAREDATALRGNIDQMIQRLQEAILLFDAEGRLQTAGLPAERMLARSRQELIGNTLDGVFPGWTQLGAAIQAAVRMQTPIFDHAVSFARNNLPEAKLLVSVEPVTGSGGKPLGTLITLRDAETRRQLESQLDISSRIAAIHRLTSGVAHEIRNPLNAITLHLEVARARVGPDQPGVSSELDIVSKELLRLGWVVKTFLNFSRPRDPLMKECDLADVVREAVQTCTCHQPPGLNVDFNPPSTKTVVMADRVLATQAIMNVLQNALEAMPTGGDLRVSISKAFEDIVVEIADSGGGIAADIGERIYNLYFTTKPEAAGIGLTETFMAMQLHNGSVDFESREGNGTVFRLRFPAGQAAA